MIDARVTKHLGSPPQSFRIAIVGMGGIGSTFAFRLAHANGHDGTAIVRPESSRLRQLKRDGGVINTLGERAGLRIAEHLHEAIPYDLVLVTLPAHQVEAVLPALQRSAATSIQFMFNTLDPERLRDFVGAHRGAFGMPFVQGSIDPVGRLNAKIGASGQKTKMDNQDWVKLFASAGLPAVFEPDMLLWPRCHVPVCISFESVSVAAMRRCGGEAAPPEQGSCDRTRYAGELHADSTAWISTLSLRQSASACRAVFVGKHAVVYVAHTFVPSIVGDRSKRVPGTGGCSGGSCNRRTRLDFVGGDRGDEAIRPLR